ncbi:hypothetical protein PGT21_008488 [Puccinia graminis f. sp. tritici]|uniref:Uncharacterized protein n=1 Tax=Puccinia graminis f. sp. tritici TaxID=56615 RepID=A0A5B0LT93_PUCGR|nr:hypothetical protein PGTUg99_028722 [Puccinia graminis f. sp. tritici]KAA1083835.1 hypothetical protein PGT21_008488 [Puccinia graminis f. sp. tritici]
MALSGIILQDVLKIQFLQICCTTESRSQVAHSQKLLGHTEEICGNLTSGASGCGLAGAQAKRSRNYGPAGANLGYRTPVHPARHDT